MADHLKSLILQCRYAIGDEVEKGTTNLITDATKDGTWSSAAVRSFIIRAINIKIDSIVSLLISKKIELNEFNTIMPEYCIERNLNANINTRRVTAPVPFDFAYPISAVFRVGSGATAQYRKINITNNKTSQYELNTSTGRERDNYPIGYIQGDPVNPGKMEFVVEVNDSNNEIVGQTGVVILLTYILYQQDITDITAQSDIYLATGKDDDIVKIVFDMIKNYKRN